LAFIMQRINRQLDTGNSPKPGAQALKGFRSIDYARLRSLVPADGSGRTTCLVAIYEDVVKSEKAGWKLRVSPEYWNGSLYDKENPRASTSFGKWAFEHTVQSIRPSRNVGLDRGTAFPAVLTHAMVIGFTEVLNGSTKPHRGTIDGVDYVLKCGSYSKTSSPAHVYNEYVADCFLRAAGCNVPESCVYHVNVNGQVEETVRLSRYLKGTRLLDVSSGHVDDGIRQQVLDTYPVMSFIAAIDTYQHSPMDNVLVDGGGKIWFVDNGASFDFCATGRRKGWFFTRLNIDDEEYGYYSLLKHPSQANLRLLLHGFSEKDLRHSASRYCFGDLIKTLPADYQQPGLVEYARRLDAWSRSGS